MLAPVRTVAPAEMPVTLDQAKAQCRVDGDDEDALISALVAAAVDHLDGWSGVLGRALVTQTWRQEFDRFSPIMRLPLLARTISTIKWRDAAGDETALADGAYSVFVDARGSYVRAEDEFVAPAGVTGPAGVSVEFVAGTPASDVPPAIKAAILLLVGHWYVNREAASDGPLTAVPMAVDALIAPFRRIGV